jgi:hypothetical protein
MSAKLQETFDPFLQRLDELQRNLSSLRDAYIRQQSGNNQSFRADSLTVAEVALVLNQEEMTIRGGVGGTNCLYQTRIKDGRSVKYPRLAVEIHQRNRQVNGSCGNCNFEYRKQFEGKRK